MSSWVTPPLLNELLDRHAAALELYAAQWTTHAEDCVQEAMLALLREAKQPDNIAAWLFRVVRNRAISMRRSAGRRQLHERRAAETAAGWFDPATGDELDAQLVTESLGTLPEEEREAVVLRVWGELSYSEIANVAGISTSTAHRRYEAGLAALRKRLEPSWHANHTCTNGPAE